MLREGYEKLILVKIICILPKKMMGAYKSFSQNVRGKNEPFPMNIYIRPRKWLQWEKFYEIVVATGLLGLQLKWVNAPW